MHSYSLAVLSIPVLASFRSAPRWFHGGVQPSSISTTHSGGWLTGTGVPVAQANELLGASYQLYYNAWTNETILLTVGYALPTVLHIHAQIVALTTAVATTNLLKQTSSRGRHGGAAA